MMPVKAILDRKKNRETYTIAPQATVYEALKLMADKEIGSLLVSEKDQVVGIFTERDYARKVALKGKYTQQTKVEEAMTSVVKSVDASAGIEECLGIMTDKRIRHLPVMEKGQLVGVVSIGDLVAAIIDHQKFHIEQLQSYIQSV